MPLSPSAKADLVARFTPLLYLSPQEPDYPVSPSDYVERAALWNSYPPHHDKATWGRLSGGERRPLIERGGISLDPAEDVHGASDPDGDGVAESYLGQRNDLGYPFLSPPEGETWLDFAAWQDSVRVGPDTGNRRTHDRPRPTLRQPWFTADVWEVDDYLAGLGSNGTARFGLRPREVPKLLGGIVVVAFHFLFPWHRQPRRRTALGPQDDPYTGDYEGDWTTFAVIARRTDEGPELPADKVAPLHGAFGQRWRGTTPDFEDHATARMQLVPWSELLTVNDHPVVVAASGTHNLYPHNPPLTAAGDVDPQGMDFGASVAEPVHKLAKDLADDPWSRVFMTKVVAGASVGGGLGGLVGAAVGAVVGVLASALEAAEAEKQGWMEQPKLTPDPPPDQDNPLVDDWEELEQRNVVAPAGINAPPLIDTARSELRHWTSAPKESLVDGSILFTADGERPTFAGRWGVRCVDDPFLLRSGIAYPDQRAAVVDALLVLG
ncbi:hypothetical protein SAMN05421505_114137 [Sinosporangium album]|uniref:Uncharacterized protein n=1 Tax=Sinosporangium album TaxID=504805 RepID=A0A1G8BRZ3_9ACTN|nr:hypothetical protein [Sinosporangium album]SDH35942.1 hypothetical protein SAMN05421505_114137 [Sinosporangium album]